MQIPLKNQPADHRLIEPTAENLRPTVLSVNLDKIASNAMKLSQHAANAPLLGVVKANAYGMGAIPVAWTLKETGVKWFGVALPEEGVELRKAGLDLPILMLGPTAPEQIPVLIAESITPAVHSLHFLSELERRASELGITVQVHLKVDSGMGRVGFRPEEIGGLIPKLKGSKHVKVAGMFSNLASADNPASNQTENQLKTFRSILAGLKDSGIDPEMVHLANSSGLLAHSSTWLKMCRPGLTLYGILPSNDLPSIGLERAVELTTRVSQVKDMPAGATVGYGATYITEKECRIAVLPVGYADGLPRSIGNSRGSVLINGTRCPIVGRVSMDLIAVNLDGAGEVHEGTTVTLWGKQGNEEITPWDWAELTGTIPYEITSGISNRVARYYTRNGKSWFESKLLQG